MGYVDLHRSPHLIQHSILLMGMCVLGKGSRIGEIIIATTYVNINASFTISILGRHI